MSKIIAIIGQPNTGKSSLFNRLTGERNAIVDDVPGVTRDRLYGEVNWRNKNFYIIDTGGIFGTDTAFSAGIKNHVQEAVNECDLIIFLTDGKNGITNSDEEIANFIRKSSGTKPVIVAVNKTDDAKHDDDNTNEAYSLGFENVISISALHKRNLYELLDLIIELLPFDESDELENENSNDEIRLAIVGKPNVGKSSLLNKISGSERSLVSPVAGTTRDPVDMPVIINNQKFRIIDTAGLRRKGKFSAGTGNDLEYYSFVRTLAAVDRADVALLLMDSNEPCTDQDKKIAAHVVEKGKGLILVMNKWDLIDTKNNKADKLVKKIRDDMPFLNFAPVIFASALNGRGLNKIIQTVLTVHENRQKRIPTNILNRLMRDVLAFDRLPSNKKGRTLKIYYASQAEIQPPTFVFFVNEPEIVTSSFEGHVKNEIRKLEDFEGVPIRVFWRGKNEKVN